jgi:uncharacterized membrane protein
VHRIIVPNYHVILIHFPLALLATGLLIELLSFRRHLSSFSVAGRWMILIGALALTPAVTSGVSALQDVMNQGKSQSDSWTDLKASSGFSSEDWEMVKDHVILNGAAAVLALIGVVLWLAGRHPFAQPTGIAIFAIMLTALLLSLLGAWHGGEMVFRQGFGVDFRKGVVMGNAPGNSRREHFDTLVQPGQIHIILAGFVFALTAGALGVSLRRCKVLHLTALASDQPVQAAATYLATPAPSIADSDPNMVPLVTERVVVPDPYRTCSSANLWLLVALLTLLAVFSGLYFGDFLVWPKIIDWEMIQTQIRSIREHDARRMGLHIVFGASILVLVLVLAAVGRWAPRSRGFFSLLSLVLILLMAAQTWVGILMLFDGGDGPITHAKSESATNSPMNMPTTIPSTQPTILPTTMP